MPPWGTRTGNIHFKWPPDGRRLLLCISPGALEGPWGRRRVHVPNPWAPQGARKDFSWELTPKIVRGRPGTVRSPHGTRKVPYGPFTGFLRPNVQIKTPGELGAANSAPRGPQGFKKTVPAPVGTLRQPAENSQNVCFYSPYGPRSVYVKTP